MFNSHDHASEFLHTAEKKSSTVNETLAQPENIMYFDDDDDNDGDEQQQLKKKITQTERMKLKFDGAAWRSAANKDETTEEDYDKNVTCNKVAPICTKKRVNV